MAAIEKKHQRLRLRNDTNLFWFDTVYCNNGIGQQGSRSSVVIANCEYRQSSDYGCTTEQLYSGTTHCSSTSTARTASWWELPANWTTPKISRLHWPWLFFSYKDKENSQDVFEKRSIVNSLLFVMVSPCMTITQLMGWTYRRSFPSIYLVNCSDQLDFYAGGPADEPSKFI